MSSLINPDIPKPWWRRMTPWIVILVMLVLGGVAVSVPMVLSAASSCADGVVKHGENGECVGVTDGSYVFDPDLADVERLIKDENDQVLSAKKPYVSVGFFVQMTLTENDTVPMSWVRHQLQGAYLAQFRADHHHVAGDLPLVRLLLVNPGTEIAAWEPAITELATRRAAPDNLVAVAGMGISTDNARKAMRRLAEMNVLMLGATVTSDDLQDIPLLLRMAPTNSGQAKAAANYIKPKAATAMLVQDSSKNDLYPATLAKSFADTFVDEQHRILGQTELYDSSLSSVDNTFLQMIPNICNSKPQVVYFAGRGKHLASFVTQLTGRRCKDHRITVLTGDDVSSTLFGQGELGRALDSGVQVVFTTLAHPEAWRLAPQAFENAATFPFVEKVCSVCFPELFPKDTLDDASAIMSYDAVLTAAHAIRFAAGNSGRVVSTADLLQVKNRLHDTMSVPGASGRLSFDERGTAVAKAVPIMTLRPNGTLEFLGLSSS